MNQIEIIETPKVNKTKSYPRGQMFIDTYDKSLYLLSRTTNKKMNLFSIKGGNRWQDSIDVASDEFITENELNQFTTNFLKRFIPVDTKITVTL